jgi:hypothetical protein
MERGPFHRTGAIQIIYFNVSEVAAAELLLLMVQVRVVVAVGHIQLQQIFHLLLALLYM